MIKEHKATGLSLGEVKYKDEHRNDWNEIVNMVSKSGCVDSANQPH